VSEKDGLVEFMTELRDIQTANNRVLKILSTGGTATELRKAGFEVMDVADYTKLKPMMDDRVKTLHPKVHGSLLGRVGIDDAVMEEQ
jgi:phosphoribosylaminoimidazolecarboxamide formyltransferase/IMP cyclohydrolase